MGLDATAELIWGIPVEAHDEDGEPTPFWNENDDDWRDWPDSDLKVRGYGHYEGELKGILTSSRIETILAWSDEGKRLHFDSLSVSDKVPSKANDAARVAGLDVDFYTDAGWHLTASYG